MKLQFQSVVTLTTVAATITLGLVSCMYRASGSIDAGSDDGGQNDGGTEWDAGTYSGCRIYATTSGGSTSELDGLTWETALGSVRDAAMKARDESPCDVWVAAGTYYIRKSTAHDTVIMSPGVKILGGFAGDETHPSQRDPVTNITILDGRYGPDSEKSVYHILTGSDGSTVDGFTIRNGVADGEFPASLGAGVVNYSASPTISNCRFENNTAKSGGGGAIDNRYSSPHVIDSTFVANQGAVRNCWSSHPVFERCLFEDNTGGILVRDESSVTIDSCLFNHNSSVSIDVNGPGECRLEAINTVFYKNGGYGSGVIEVEDNCTAEVINCTFLDNYVSGGAALSVSDNADGTVANSVFWDNETAQMTADNQASLQVSYSLVQGGYAGTAIIDDDPEFADPEWLHFEPLATSPCIDRADGNHAPMQDMSGRDRYDMAGVDNTDECAGGDDECCDFADIGALEYTPQGRPRRP